MSTTPTPQPQAAANPDVNPFDAPIATPQSAPQAGQPQQPKQFADDANPFDAPIPAPKSGSPAAGDDASNTRQMLVAGLTGMPTPNMTDADKQSFQTGRAVGAGSATLLSAAPLLGAIAPHLPTLDKAWKIATALGGTAMTVDHLVHVLKVLNGKEK